MTLVGDDTATAGTDGPRGSLDDLGRGLFLDPVSYLHEVVDLLRDKGQVVFYGPPGTGKTYVARKLAGYIAGSPRPTWRRCNSTPPTRMRTSSRDTGPGWRTGR